MWYFIWQHQFSLPLKNVVEMVLLSVVCGLLNEFH